jgi:hypothetical protein
MWRNSKGSAQGAARTTKGKEFAPRSVVRDKRRGSAVIEAALLMPWICFLFVGILDSGFYTYAAMATQNAARAVAIQAAQGALANACSAVQKEMGLLPNVYGTSCATTQALVSNKNSLPIWVCTGNLTSTTSSQCGQPTRICADCGPVICPAPCAATSVQAVVTYESIPLVPIPGILPVQLQLTRIAEARVIQ